MGTAVQLLAWAFKLLKLLSKRELQMIITKLNHRLYSTNTMDLIVVLVMQEDLRVL